MDKKGQQQDADETGDSGGIVQGVTLVQVGAVHTQHGHHEAADHTQQNAEGDAGSQRLHRGVAPHALADEGRQRGGEQGDVDAVLKGGAIHEAEDQRAQNTGPDIQEVHAGVEHADDEHADDHVAPLTAAAADPEAMAASPSPAARSNKTQ